MNECCREGEAQANGRRGWSLAGSSLSGSSLSGSSLSGSSLSGSSLSGSSPLLGVGLPVVLALLATGCAFKPRGPELDAPSAARSKLGSEPMELALRRYPELTEWKLSSLRGKVVLLDVWATWCDPCRESLPLYADMLKEYGPRGFEVVAVSVDDNPQLIGPFLVETKVALPIVVDPGAKEVGDRLKVAQLPTAFLLDRRGQVRVVHEGFDEGLFSTWLQEIEGLLAEPP